jgi:hypothetical protein
MWKKRLVHLQVHPYRCSLTGIILPVRKYLQTFSSDLFAQRDDLCGQLHVVYPGRYSCGSVPVGLYLWREGLYSEAIRRDMDKIAAVMSFDALWS